MRPSRVPVAHARPSFTKDEVFGEHSRKSLPIFFVKDTDSFVSAASGKFLVRQIHLEEESVFLARAA
jgi:hypothetical protein